MERELKLEAKNWIGSKNTADGEAWVSREERGE